MYTLWLQCFLSIKSTNAPLPHMVVSLAATCDRGGVVLPATCVDIALPLKQLALCGSIGSDICSICCVVLCDLNFTFCSLDRATSLEL